MEMKRPLKAFATAREIARTGLISEGEIESMRREGCLPGHYDRGRYLIDVRALKQIIYGGRSKMANERM